ncbi:hypothetical protein [Anaeromicrobium sediminis]|uniref:Uncharacterized protein n=1 Tax=Anaeromicrobium sediminis TaxID=1478221 RepID=A0A267MLF9_9FIRM|nr:hypothetical protein [Anaeromicrobium sediminis]PAB60242.1 hypothetical protein CCE28_04910 [Anaeromicrobium sediminis]
MAVQSFAYVTNEGDDAVSVIRISDNTVVDTILDVGEEPVGVAITPPKPPKIRITNKVMTAIIVDKGYN